MALVVSSSAFDANQPIPAKYTGEGEDVSPPLSWRGVPSGTKEFALLCEDPDAPRPKPWVHWVLAGIPEAATGLTEGDSTRHVEGRNDFGKNGYGGPMPPPGHGVHHYHFKVFALDQPSKLAPGASKEDLLAAVKGHVLAEGELIGTYERK